MGKLTEHPAIREPEFFDGSCPDMATCPSCFGNARVECSTCEGVGELTALQACSLAAHLLREVDAQKYRAERAETSLAMATAERDSAREQLEADRQRYKDEIAMMLSVSEQQAARISQLVRGAA